MAGIERFDQPLDGATFAGGVPAFEHDADRWSESAFVELTAIDQPQVQQAALRAAEPLGLLVFAQAQCEVGILEAGVTPPVGVAPVLAAEIAADRSAVSSVVDLPGFVASAMINVVTGR